MTDEYNFQLPRTPHHTVQHQGLDDSAKALHKFLDFRGGRWCVGNISDHQQAAPADWNRTLLNDKKEYLGMFKLEELFCHSSLQ